MIYKEERVWSETNTYLEEAVERTRQICTKTALMHRKEEVPAVKLH